MRTTNQRPLPHRAVHASRHSRGVADGAALFFFGPNPAATGEYNPLQKLAYTSTIKFGVLSRLTGIVLFKPAQFSLPGVFYSEGFI